MPAAEQLTLIYCEQYLVCMKIHEDMRTKNKWACERDGERDMRAT